jgi:hypothetical protein
VSLQKTPLTDAGQRGLGVRRLQERPRINGSK